MPIFFVSHFSQLKSSILLVNFLGWFTIFVEYILSHSILNFLKKKVVIAKENTSLIKIFNMIDFKIGVRKSVTGGKRGKRKKFIGMEN